jgi:hypothetical protein
VDGATPAELAPYYSSGGSDSGGPAYIHNDDAMAPAPVPGFASRKASEHAVEASAAPVAEAAPPVESPWKWSFGIGTNEPEDARELACLSENPFERNLPTQCYGVYGYRYSTILHRTILHRTILRHTGSVCFCVMYMWFGIEGFP